MKRAATHFTHVCFRFNFFFFLHRISCFSVQTLSNLQMSPRKKCSCTNSCIFFCLATNLIWVNYKMTQVMEKKSCQPAVTLLRECLQWHTFYEFETNKKIKTFDPHWIVYINGSSFSKVLRSVTFDLWWIHCLLSLKKLTFHWNHSDILITPSMKHEVTDPKGFNFLIYICPLGYKH